MSTALLYPPPEIVASLQAKGALSLRALCALAGVPCRASGAWTERKVRLVRGTGLRIRKEPGDEGMVEIALPDVAGVRSTTAARAALGVLAYGLMDLVARESVRHADWARPAPPRGRPKTGLALPNRERQRRFRERRARAASG
jgi:hypothetical protein